MSWPAYLEFHRSGELRRRSEAAQQILATCRLCPRECGVRRLDGETGVCGAGSQAVVSSYGPHFGEEAPLVGFGGSGTIFLAHCNLCCVFCQNYEISHQGGGRAVCPHEFAQMMLELQRQGCHNINFVTPTHEVPQILQALLLAVEGGLRLPLVYNSGGYDSLETLRLLDGVMDIYMPDLKYGDAAMGKRYSGVENYPEVARAALREMHRQVGDLALDERGIATRGVLVRHLVLPNGLAGTADVVRFLADLSKDMYVNLMNQYHPWYRANEEPLLSRRITRKEFDEALSLARDAGLHRLDGY
ncbi:MAG TPA: radical SAM protein [Candidatus Methylomirabilis sp.]|nr:radical SAM protein [Candidatus Methylomirabilis sp.]